ncbi:EipB family protein [Thalassospira mesophila]|uniref:ATP-binding protein n=1 Tax=Thalassospira mesophila TaxID=1293891 RepID=A0A1Y2KXA6_9PROT|nr:DUF1849 family protein [Thalassospira mesophila]OSQ36577.1 hypothetical protein TMES_17505 [Thalassospira mesophila]
MPENLRNAVGRQAALALTVIFGAALGGCSAQAGPSPAANGLVSHVAEYRLRLVSTSANSSVIAARGAFGFRFEKVCDGWISELRNSLILQGPQGGAINSSYSMTQWEDFAAKHYRFRVRDFQDGYLTDEVNGNAERQDDKVVVHYEKPVEVTEELPVDTLFPTQHSIKLLQRALDGQTFASDRVFDGGGDTPTYQISSVVSGAIPADNKAKDEDHIASNPFHRISMAFFPIENDDERPAYEMSIDYGKNGVAQGLVQNYGDFKLKGDLIRVRELPAPQCD